MCAENCEKPLPKIVEDFIGCIIKKVGRSKKVRRDVWQELTDHFTDALREFQTETERQQVAEHLVGQFGDPQMLAALIKRSKKRCRPLWWRITRRTLAAIGIFIAYLVINFAINYLPQPMPEFSRQTTYLTNPPIDKDGLIDYAGWLNQQNSRGVTPENNMLTAFIKIMGKDSVALQKDVPQQLELGYLKIIGVEITSGKSCFIKSEEFAKKHNIPANDIFHDLTSLDMRPWTKSESQLTYEYLEANKTALAELEKAVELPKYYSPYVSYNSMLECLLPSLNKFRTTIRIFICRSNLEIGNGNLDAAWKDAMKVRKFGLHLTAKKDKYLTLIEQLVGIAINALADKQASRILASEKLTLSQAKTFLQQWNNLAICEASINDIMLSERMMLLDFAIRQSQGRLTASITGQFSTNEPVKQKLFQARFNPTNLMTLANKYYDELECTGNRILQGYAPVEDNSSKYKPNLSELIVGLIAPQPFQNKIWGKVLISTFYPGLQTAFILIKREDTQYELVKTGFALRIYQLEKGQYPEKLSDLSAELLREYDISLIDPFGGNEYKYFRTPKGFKLYSFGINYIDDGGKEEGNGKPDIVLEVPFAMPEKYYRR